MLMKMVTMSLEVHFIPVKKLAMLYTKVLANLFKDKTGQSTINPRTVFDCK